MLTGTADDSASGGSDVTAYQIDSGSWVAVAGAAGVTSPLSATILASTVASLSEGAHPISVRATDALGNVGSPVTISLQVDKTGPGSGTAAIAPNPNDGHVSYDPNDFGLKATAQFTDTASTVVYVAGNFVTDNTVCPTLLKTDGSGQIDPKGSLGRMDPASAVTAWWQTPTASFRSRR